MQKFPTTFKYVSAPPHPWMFISRIVVITEAMYIYMMISSREAKI